MPRVVAAIIAMALLAGCAPQVTPQQTAQIKSLTVVTGFGEQIELNFVGFTVFTNKRETVPVDWNIDGHFKERALAELGSRYGFQAVTYDPAKLRQPRQELFGSDPAVALVQSVVRQGVADAVLYFGPSGFEDTLGHSNQYVEGLGLYGRSALGLGQQRNVVFAAYRAILFDGKTLQPVAQARALFPFSMGGIFGGSGSRIPNTPSINFPDRYDSLSPGQRTIIQRQIFELIDKTLPQVLADLALR
jgi:hypothetical protein